MFTVGRWRHSSCLDVDFYITKLFEENKVCVLYLLQRNNQILDVEIISLPHLSHHWRQVG